MFLQVSEEYQSFEQHSAVILEANTLIAVIGSVGRSVQFMVVISKTQMTIDDVWLILRQQLVKSTCTFLQLTCFRLSLSDQCTQYRELESFLSALFNAALFRFVASVSCSILSIKPFVSEMIGFQE